MRTAVQTEIRWERTQRSVLWPWIAWTTAGETVGFGIPAVVAVLVLDRPAVVVLAAMLAAGAAEGAVLGAAQARVLRQAVPNLRARDWIGATAAAAVFAWSIGLVPTVAGDELSRWPSWLLVPLAGMASTALLLAIGAAQWLVLRRHVARAGRWVIVTAAAWLAGLAVFLLVASPLWQEGQPPVVTAAVGAFAGFLMAAVVAAVTGVGLVRLLAASARQNEDDAVATGENLP